MWTWSYHLTPTTFKLSPSPVSLQLLWWGFIHWPELYSIYIHIDGLSFCRIWLDLTQSLGQGSLDKCMRGKIKKENSWNFSILRWKQRGAPSIFWRIRILILIRSTYLWPDRPNFPKWSQHYRIVGLYLSSGLYRFQRKLIASPAHRIR